MSIETLNETINKARPGKEANWPDPQPLPDGMPPVEPFAIELLPRSLAPWISDISERLQCPPDYAAIGAMVALAALVGRQIAIRPKRQDDWTVVPNLWGAVVGRPGMLKTPTLQEATRPLITLEIKAKEKHEKELEDFKAKSVVDKAAWGIAEGRIKKRLKEGANAETVAAEFSDVLKAETPPCRRRYVTNDATVEKLGELLNENPRGILVNRDELMGWLTGLERDGREQDRAFYLEAWNGSGRFTYDRIGRGTIDIENVCLSLLGGIQPGPLAQYLEATVQGGVADDGLLQRFQMLVWPDPPRNWRDVDRWRDGAARSEAYAAFERLDAIDPVAIGATCDDASGPWYLRFEQDAQEAFSAWRVGLEEVLRSGSLHPALEAHLAKYRSLVPSLALIIHLADGGIGAVGHVALERALKWAAYLESHALRLYDNVLRSDLTAARVLGQKILEGRLADGFTLRDAYRPQWAGLSHRETVAAAIEVLEDLDWLQPKKQESSGRPKIVFRINPKLISKEGKPVPSPVT
ncbi:YfjI family protein [Geminicoccus harenae]|uniref:YfjI family protein n=1 Tax=Geminicoccus harenae TaxID=2498453 RepID=UPI001C97C421|nr:YfjI family protein [Geminicoccus harenae]